MSTRAVEIHVTESMLNEVNPVIPADVRKFFLKAEESFVLDVSGNETIDAYMGNDSASNHIHSYGRTGLRDTELVEEPSTAGRGYLAI